MSSLIPCSIRDQKVIEELAQRYKNAYKEYCDNGYLYTDFPMPDKELPALRFKNGKLIGYVQMKCFEILPIEQEKIE